MDEKTKITPVVESFRGYISALDAEFQASGSIAIPFIAFARACGANVDEILDKRKLDVYMDMTAAEYGTTVTKHNEGDI